MNKRLLVTLAALSLLLIVGCGDKDSTVEQTATADPHAGHDHAEAAPMAAGFEVVETFDSGGYTYVRLATPDGDVWAAGPQSEMTVGRKVSIEGAMPMQNFKSNTLDRTFETIYFVGGFAAPAAAAVETELKQAHGNLTQGDPGVDVSGVEKAEGGYTVAEVYGLDAAHAGSRVIVRGKVVKVLTGILGHNWLHLQDGSGDQAAGTHDLTVTTNALASIGETVTIDGLLAVNKDFGSGYFYKAIVEDAAVTVE